ncbi:MULTISPECIES: lysine N(6)-hydroxylase/L-ornithine N(5)-oxygenase family protein [Phyllobacteriaceae]|jgi:lysine N6-hydroxylase|uniref:Lysine 6-monooxygenase n=3 Tax=Bacteria TaxID=2 RepID=A0A1C2EC24_9HYPH|nr:MULTISPECIES: SidA/IucD/PvdA family monooxygenase [Mesorhizobium]MBN9237581.1 SidA/IucD/PvdA family monooxygenase [Mesorhizobium sp.]MDQ0331793.1 lysine N6-hydroxylase [Mesorhizobium sp. YL-MeA3-2017]OCX24517.1 lysine 6-monooxygenase [Mesorhizobium hungaricum]
MTSPVLDLAGIGVGPFHLSLAAHLDAIPAAKAHFFDDKPAFDWHPGMMLEGVELQTSFMKDLVTATLPTSPWTFASYLVSQKRFYEFLNADFDAIPRREFARYLAWVAGNLDNLRFGRPVREVRFEDGLFHIRLDDDACMARNLSLGVGLKPNIPAWGQVAHGQSCFHTSEAAYRLEGLKGRRIVVVGGGQSGAEIMQHLLSRPEAASQSIAWISRRQNFQTLDDSPFTDEFFTPHYVERFHALPHSRRQATVAQQKLAGDGISASTLRAIYQKSYALRHLSADEHDLAFMPHREVLDLRCEGGEFRLVMRNGFDGSVEMASADAIVLATGYVFTVPEFLAPLADRLDLDERGLYRLRDDFSVEWDGPASARIFALNAGRHSHGIAEPQLSLMAWRSAVIVNALLGRRHFDLSPRPSAMRWTADAAPALSQAALQQPQARG